MISEIRVMVFDFDGVFTDNRVLVLEDGAEGVFCNRSDGVGLEEARRKGIQSFVLSQEVNPVVTARCKKLGLYCIQGCNDKAEALQLELKKRSVVLKNVAYLGNDINDLECLRIVGLPAIVSDAQPEVRSVAQYVTQAPGGHGAVREFCRFIIQSSQRRNSFSSE